MPSLTCFNRRFTPSWPMIFLSTLVISLFLKLGFWQIQRADEKKKMLQAASYQKMQDPIWLNSEQNLPNQYQKVKVQGRYLTHLLLLDNQHYEHQFGYDVISPVLLKNDAIVLVDRGWIPADHSKLNLSSIPLHKKIIQGIVYFPSNNPWVLGPDHEEKTNNVTVIEKINSQWISQLLQKKVYPFIIRLDREEAYGFVRDWPIVSMPPQRHLAYALQWFTMALVIFILFAALNIKKDNDNKNL